MLGQSGDAVHSVFGDVCCGLRLGSQTTDTEAREGTVKLQGDIRLSDDSN